MVCYIKNGASCGKQSIFAMGRKRTFLSLMALVLGSSLLLVSCNLNVSSTMTYGAPRTFQIDAVVGHHDGPGHPSHFECLNLAGQVEVIEFPGGDQSHARTYMGPHLSGPDKAEVAMTLRFLDLRGNGRLDMLIQAQEKQTIFLNDGEKFVPVPANEEQQLLQQLQRLEVK